MIIPDTTREKEFWARGHMLIAGVDEAGRGPLAGPVVAGAVIFGDDEDIISELLGRGLRDSKKTSEKKREELYAFIIANARCWAVEAVSEKVIDEINILQATKLAMRRALEKLALRADHVLIDGNATLDDFPISQTAIPKADEHIFTVSAAAILAKVTRDRIMEELDGVYPGYGFAKHKGYGTAMHMEALVEKGPSTIHRRSFEPIKSMVER
jgi:ribonuclease HII